MQPTRVTVLLVGGLLSGCVGGPYPRPYGYSPVYGGQYYGDRYWYGNRDWYDDRYYGRSARELAEDQVRAKQRLRRDQEERRENLLHQQEERREVRQDEGTWKKKNVRYQRQQQQDQRERFRREREKQRQRQDRAWERY
jgi:hypothetical protein